MVAESSRFVCDLLALPALCGVAEDSEMIGFLVRFSLVLALSLGLVIGCGMAAAWAFGVPSLPFLIITLLAFFGVPISAGCVFADYEIAR